MKTNKYLEILEKMKKETSVEKQKEFFLEIKRTIELTYNIRILFAYVRGSHMYGLNTPTSDVDITFVFQVPTDVVLREELVDYIDLCKSGDFVGFEISKYLKLLSANNPNILESLDVPKNCLIFRDSRMDWVFTEANKDLWVTKQTQKTILNYAKSQIQKATGLNKNMNKKMDEKRKTILDFCYWVKGDTIPFAKHYLFKGMGSMEEIIEKTQHWGIRKTKNGKGLYAVFSDVTKNKYNGLLKDRDSVNFKTSQIDDEDFELNFIGNIEFDIDAFQSHCKEHAGYLKWLKERNEDRFKMNQEAGSNIDLKNMMHMFRILQQALRISQGKGFTTNAESNDFLNEIKKGVYKYEYLLELSESLIEEINSNYEKIDLPEERAGFVSKDILLKFRKDF